MLSQIRIKNSVSTAEIDIEGVIGVAEEAQFDDPDRYVATYDRFRQSLERIAAIKARKVVVNIRSTGGDVNHALLIYDSLMELKSKIVTRCYGYVASAATVIAQAASPGCRQISSSALYLIHCSRTASDGTAHTMEHARELLALTDSRIAAIYAHHGGASQQQFQQLMGQNSGNGRWLSPVEAIELGLADRIIRSQDVGAQDLAQADLPSDLQLLGALSVDKNGKTRSELGRTLTQRVSDGWHSLLSHLGLGGNELFVFPAADMHAESNVPAALGNQNQAGDDDQLQNDAREGGATDELQSEPAAIVPDTQPSDAQSTHGPDTPHSPEDEHSTDELAASNSTDVLVNGGSTKMPVDETREQPAFDFASRATARPTCVEQVEDPSIDDIRPHNNRSAYDQDWRQMIAERE